MCESYDSRDPLVTGPLARAELATVHEYLTCRQRQQHCPALCSVCVGLLCCRCCSCQCCMSLAQSPTGHIFAPQALLSDSDRSLHVGSIIKSSCCSSHHGDRPSCQGCQRKGGGRSSERALTPFGIMLCLRHYHSCRLLLLPVGVVL